MGFRFSSLFTFWRLWLLPFWLLLALPKVLATPSDPTENTAYVEAMQCLAVAVHMEARGESVTGQRAVLDTILHRAVKSGTSVCEVVAARKQFSWYKPGSFARHTDAMQQQLLLVWQHPKVLLDYRYRFFYSGATPYWATNMTCRKLGRHNFCKENKR